eukprot:CAMPEP_0171812174 /NCGR_PEP_ID=MMETSP0991-20121206/78545_1 /TAXON_ID=483369 /ORGANISM="non described non described, Strain CCMP2098" /LENGTH=116 /DNA_ID=CAMNT_0012425679 /DNA_START=352 /DNA_END=702 /DNA_ORIENTATION=+
MTPFRGCTLQGLVRAVRGFLLFDDCAVVVMTTPVASLRHSSGSTACCVVTKYVLAFPFSARRHALGSWPSLVSKITPVVSLSSLPTGKTLCWWFTAATMFPSTVSSVVHSTPEGLL